MNVCYDVHHGKKNRLTVSHGIDQATLSNDKDNTANCCTVYGVDAFCFDGQRRGQTKYHRDLHR